MVTTEICIASIFSIVCSYLCSQLYVSAQSQCTPAEQGREYVTTFFLPRPNFTESIRIEAPLGRLATCNINQMNCTDHFSRLAKTKIKHSEGSITVTLMIHNISISDLYSDQGIWFSAGFIALKLIHQDIYCRPKVFSRAHNLTLSIDTSEEGLQVTCSTQRIYPEGKCNFLGILNNFTMDSTIISESNVEIPGNPKYFISKCTIVVHKSNISQGIYMFKVSMYPNITNDEYADVQYGKEVTKTLHLRSPSVTLADCPKAVEIGTEVKCTCKENTTSRIGEYITWYDAAGHVISSNQSSLLHFQAQKNLKDYYCQAKNMFGWKSELVFYKPNVLYPAMIQYLMVNGESKDIFHVKQRTNISIQCEVDGYPTPELRLFNGNILLYQRWSPSSPHSVNLTHLMTCDSYNRFTCVAVQSKASAVKSVNVYVECSSNLKFPLINSTIKQLHAELYGNVSVVIDIYGYPRPKNYCIVTSTSKIQFDNVSDSNTMAGGYIIKYQDVEPPYGILNLGFTILEQEDFTNYLFIIDNGVIPTLNYSFYINGGSQVKDTTDNTIISIVSLSISAITAAISLFVWCFCKRKARDQSRKSLGEMSLDINQEIYEEIELNDEEEINASNVENEEDMTSNYDIIDETLMLNDDKRSDDSVKANARENQYDMVDTETTGEGYNYTKLVTKWVEWDTEYITVIDNMVLEDSECIFLLDASNEHINQDK